MRHAHNLPRRRDAFTLIELLVVMVLILVIASVGLGYIVFGQDNQHSVNGAQALTGALLNAKQRARRDGLPTGVRILFTAPRQATSPNLTQSAFRPTRTHPAAGRLQRRSVDQRGRDRNQSYDVSFQRRRFPGRRLHRW